ncbi:hypothetical protein BU24DRAFT_482070 [Aaosphaeria arxii CBS 175.79]|uniref:Transcription factor domain-containing protein n=1 Tax=Aaosphaeria arxii CBS 175.79 TaxID=1450172 RepID=A0A6A5XMS8_9PLEO|nr:uncharacterized protein BU24DRAFT_482070 [Aaosphaeria arxii CBS 175.79]KAF2014565.1 hypothetical protein BU24DRAFT_482070 [Aaosphaeria arxii CBS 175.79]
MFTLRGWYYSLSKEFKIRPNNINRDQPLLPQVCVLNMVYYTSVVLLAKPFLRSGKGEAPESNEVLRAASSACLEAATEICLLGERYREVFGSFRRSPLTATHCTLTAALVIMLVRDDPVGTWPQADRTKLGGCLQTLHELSISWGPPLRYWRTLTKMINQRKSQDGTTEENSAAAASGDDAQVVDPNTMPSTFIDQPDQLHLGSKAEVASSDISIEIALQDPPIPDQDLWGNASTAHTFPDVGWLDIGAFDALSWDLASQIGPDGQIWEMGSSWQNEGHQ